MPRTKRPAKKQEKSTENSEALKKLDNLILEKKKKIDDIADMEIRNIEMAFKILLSSISSTYLQKTVGQLKNEMHLKDTTNTRQTRHSKRSGSHDDGYLTEGTSSQGSGDRGLKKPIAPSTASRSRSADASARKLAPPSSRNVLRRRSKSVYRTPRYNKNSCQNYPIITPKVNPQTPLTVLRQPRQGEMVVSMSGSPVMVPSCYAMQPEEKANCNILLQDGTMLSLQPKLLRQSQAYIPFSLMDPSVLQQLKTLKDNLGKVVKLGEEAMK